jgi:hypothetical protein
MRSLYTVELTTTRRTGELRVLGGRGRCACAVGLAGRAAALLAWRTVPAGIHHSVVVVRDLEVSLGFDRDGIGLDLLTPGSISGERHD